MSRLEIDGNEAYLAFARVARRQDIGTSDRLARHDFVAEFAWPEEAKRLDGIY